jgi:hypothetical protein
LPAASTPATATLRHTPPDPSDALRIERLASLDSRDIPNCVINRGSAFDVIE